MNLGFFVNNVHTEKEFFTTVRLAMTAITEGIMYGLSERVILPTTRMNKSAPGVRQSLSKNAVPPKPISAHY